MKPLKELIPPLFQEINEVIRKLNKNKLLGPDNIVAELIKYGEINKK